MREEERHAKTRGRDGRVHQSHTHTHTDGDRDTHTDPQAVSPEKVPPTDTKTERPTDKTEKHEKTQTGRDRWTDTQT